MTAAEQAKAGRAFAEKWKNRGHERADCQPFWLSLLRDVLGCPDPEDVISFEDAVHLDAGTGFIDARIDSTHVLIEQKGRGRSLDQPAVQSDGTRLTPFQQAKRYSLELPYSQRPRWVVTCNFEEMRVYDMENPGAEPERIRTADLGREYYRLQFLTDRRAGDARRETELSVAAGDLVGRLYDAFLEQYRDPADPAVMHSLNVLCVRLVFCLYSEDSGIFRHGQFREYLSGFSTGQMRRALLDLFAVLNRKPEERDPYLAPELAEFPYVNGGLFQEEVEVPLFSPRIRELLLEDASRKFDWSRISPTIFGAVFESTLNPETRRSGGMHYTSVENIHRVLDPLFLDGLNRELEAALGTADPGWRTRRLREFKKKLAGIRILDPACGSGNFLTEAFLSLRRLENRVIREQLKTVEGQMAIGGVVSDEDLGIGVSITQFSGIEINDFAVSVARTALWIAEHQMMQETSAIVDRPMEFLPLKTNARIIEGNALRMDWKTAAPPEGLTYIVGNPPFAGARVMGAAQKDDVTGIFRGWKHIGSLDYVSCWFKKAADMMTGTSIRTALVATSSISQGDSVAVLWERLFAEGVQIDFARRTFRWDSEAAAKAHVYCVIIGFSKTGAPGPRLLFTEDGCRQVEHINAYLSPGPDIFVRNTSKSLCESPAAGTGNKPIDGGYYLFTREERDGFIRSEPASAEFFRPWYGAWELISGEPRYCLWLGDCPPDRLRQMPKCRERVQKVMEYRRASRSPGTVKLADRPVRFHVENMPSGPFIAIPQVTSSRRQYVPIAFLGPECLASNLLDIVETSSLYVFGVLTSSTHMAWMRAVGGRLTDGYRYSVGLVYNTFPWCTPPEQQKAKIESTAQRILDARALYPACSLADLYDDAAMPAVLRKAHRDNDRAVMDAYGIPEKDRTEEGCLAFLMERYRELTEK